MNKPIFFAIGIFLGAAATLGAAYTYYQPRIEIARAETEEQRALAQSEAARQETLNEKIARLEKEYGEQQEYIAKLQADLEAAPATAVAAQAQAEASADEEEDVGGILGDWLTDLDDRIVDVPGDDSEQTEEDARREQWRTEFRARMRENVNGFIADAMAAARTPKERDRLAAISDYSHYLMETRDRLRNATPEEQEAIREEMGAAVNDVRKLIREQQRTLISDVVSRYGVSKPGQQRQLANELRETMESPFFSAERYFGGGQGGPRRGRGGR